MTSTPTPATLFGNRKAATVPPAPVRTPQQIAVINPTDPGKRVTLGLVDEVVTTLHDGVVKTKHLERGQRVRAFVKGEPRGGERIVDTVTKIEDGEYWHVTFASPHPAMDYKAAYRWYDASLKGTEVPHLVKRQGFVPAFENEEN